MALVLWAASMLTISGVLMASHWVRLPSPAAFDPTLQRAAAMLHAQAPGRWQLIHVLYSECRCSRRIIDYLLQRAPLSGVVDTVVVAGAAGDAASALRARGIAVEELGAERLEQRMGVVAAPLLVVVDPEAMVRYVGGHSERQGASYEDLAIVARLMRGEPSEAFGVYGCAVSRELQSYLDPIGVKY